MGVRLCSSAQLAMLLEVKSLKLPGFAQGSGQPLTAAWLCFVLKFGCQAPIAANAAVVCRLSKGEGFHVKVIPIHYIVFF